MATATHTHTHTHTHAYTHTHAHMYAQTHTMHTHARTERHRRACHKHAYTDTHMHTQTHAHTQICHHTGAHPRTCRGSSVLAHSASTHKTLPAPVLGAGPEPPHRLSASSQDPQAQPCITSAPHTLMLPPPLQTMFIPWILRASPPTPSVQHKLLKDRYK